ncbi:MAG: hypothetical protein LBH69_01325, partial [Methanomassiliicoccaceae archaeon]|nr:hypothetical protein [Methanomassiliicoccaceae archaeon]
MGDANTSRTSKGKGVLGGLVGSLKRATGGKKEETATAPRTGVSIRERFSALRPNAAPTDAVPPKMSEDIPDPDSGKDVKVIHTSTVRSSGSVRFSERIGLAVGSEAEEGYDRKITFEDGDRRVIEDIDDIGDTAEAGITETVPDAAVPEETAAEVRDVVEIDVVDDTGSISAVIAPAATVADKAGTKAAAEEKRPLLELRKSPAEEKRAAAETKVAAEEKRPLFEIKKTVVEEKRTVAEVKAPAEERIAAEVKVPVEEKTAVPETIQETVKEEPAAAVAAPNDAFDDGYDFLPRRSLSDRILGKQAKPAKEAAPAPEPKKESTALAERMKVKNKDKGPRKHTEVQVDAPVRHEAVARTSLLDRVLHKKEPAKSVSEVISETEMRPVPETAAPAVPEEIEECDAEVSVAASAAAETAPEVTFVPVREEIPEEYVPSAEIGMPEEVTEPPAAYVEIEAEEIAEVPEIAEAEAPEDIPEASAEIEAEEIAEAPVIADIEAPEDIPEASVEIEAEEVIEVPEIAVTEAAEEVPEAYVEIEAEEVIEVPETAEIEIAEEVTEPPAAYVEVEAEEVIEVPEIAEIEIAEDIPEVCAE